jgi:hypothetical protein
MAEKKTGTKTQREALFKELIGYFFEADAEDMSRKLSRIHENQEEVKKNAEERKKIIERTGRVTGKRFRL